MGQLQMLGWEAESDFFFLPRNGWAPVCQPSPLTQIFPDERIGSQILVCKGEFEAL